MSFSSIVCFKSKPFNTSLPHTITVLLKCVLNTSFIGPIYESVNINMFFLLSTTWHGIPAMETTQPTPSRGRHPTNWESMTWVGTYENCATTGGITTAVPLRPTLRVLQLELHAITAVVIAKMKRSVVYHTGIPTIHPTEDFSQASALHFPSNACSELVKPTLLSYCRSFE